MHPLGVIYSVCRNEGHEFKRRALDWTVSSDSAPGAVDGRAAGRKAVNKATLNVV